MKWFRSRAFMEVKEGTAILLPGECIPDYNFDGYDVFELDSDRE